MFFDFIMRKNISDSKLHVFEKCYWEQMRLYLFKNVVQNLNPGETLRYSASHWAQNYVQRSLM